MNSKAIVLVILLIGCLVYATWQKKRIDMLKKMNEQLVSEIVELQKDLEVCK